MDILEHIFKLCRGEEYSDVPRIGYEIDHWYYHTPEAETDEDMDSDAAQVVVLAPYDQTADLFMALLEPFGLEIDVNMRRPDEETDQYQESFWRDSIDTCVFRSRIIDVVKWVENDPLLEIDVYDLDEELEMRLLPDKKIIISTSSSEALQSFKNILHGNNILPNPTIEENTPHKTDAPDPKIYTEEALNFLHIITADQDSDLDLDDPDRHAQDDPYGFRGDDWKGEDDSWEPA